MPRYTHINISRQNVIKYLMSWLAVNIWWVEFYEFRALVLNMVLNFWIVDSIRNWWKLWNLCSDKSTFLSTHNFACILWISFIHVELNAHDIYVAHGYKVGFRDGSEGKASACNAGDLGSIPGSGTSPGEGNGNPLQYSCLKKSHGLQSMGSKESDTTEQLHFLSFLDIRSKILNLYVCSIVSVTYCILQSWKIGNTALHGCYSYPFITFYLINKWMLSVWAQLLLDVSVIKNLPAIAGDPGLIFGSGRYPGGGNCNPLQYSCLENLTDRGAWRAGYSPWGHKSQTWLSD